jgi:Di-haem oxidoreductase, putative peroxidase
VVDYHTQRVIRFSLVCMLVAASNAWGGPANRQVQSGAVQTPAPVELYGFGSPLPAVVNNASDLQIFATGQINFKEVETLPQVGPVFNDVSCAGCHSQPAIGGAGLFINEIRVRNNTAAGPVHIFAVDNMLRSGPQSQDGTTIFAEGVRAEPLGCQITAPGCQPSPCQKQEMARTTFQTNLPTCDPSSTAFATGGNCVVGRAATPLFGLGLVEAVSDQTLMAEAQNEPSQVRGTIKELTEFGSERVARFGWKEDHATLLGFAGDAYLNEMGITNPNNPTEVSECAVNESQFGVVLQTNDGVEDTTDPDGRADVDRFADFMRALSPPPRLAQNSSAQNGARLFAQSGCAGCHAPSLTTDPNPASFIPPSTGGIAISSTLNAALASQTFHPFSDFLLHDMGSLGDGITSGTAGPTMMRTAPLWGLRAKSVYLHDGRATDIPTAISLHDGQGKAAAQAFQSLSAQQQQDLINFLNTI